MSAHPDVDAFLVHLEKERNVSSHTLKAYGRDCAEFVAFLTEYYGGASWTWQGVDRLAMRGFLARLNKRGLSRRSVARSLADSLPAPRLRVPPHVGDLHSSWRFRAEGDGTRAIQVITYAAGLVFVATLAHEPTQWVLRRQAAGCVERLAEAARSRSTAGSG